MTTPTNRQVAVSALDARERLLRAALRVLAAERASGHADSAAEAEYADDLLAIAARDLTRAYESGPGWVVIMADTPPRLVTISRETTALTTLPDALLDDEAIGPMAKMAYWYLKRHGGDVLVSDVARALRMDRQNPWVLIIELGDAGWVDYPTIAQQVGDEPCKGPRFTVHEMPAVKR